MLFSHAASPDEQTGNSICIYLEGWTTVLALGFLSMPDFGLEEI